MVLFGVPATKPETGYGYIRSSQDALLPEGVARVAQFVEARREARQRVRPRRRLLLEQRHVPVPRQPLPRRAEKHDPDIYDTCLLAWSAATNKATC